MAKAKRIPTKYTGVFRLGPDGRYGWQLKRNGKLQSGTADTEDEARRARAAADLEGPAPAGARGDFGTHALEWVETYQGRTRRGFSESSRVDYRQTLTNYAIPFFDDVRPRKWAQVTRPDVKAFAAWLERGAGKDLVFSARTIDKHLSCLHTLYADAVHDRLYTIGPNPVAGVHANVRAEEIDLADDDNERRPFAPAQLAAVLEAATGEDRTMLDLLAEIGPRWGELCELRGRDLKNTPAGPRLAIRRAWDAKAPARKPGQRRGRVGRPKSGKVREIPLSPDLWRALIRLQRGPDELLFTSPLGERMHYQNTLRRVLEPLLERAQTDEEGNPRPDVGDLDWAAFHTFRHTCASLQFAHGRNVRQVCRWLGHHKPSYTLDTYIHLMPDDADEPFLVGEALAGAAAAGATSGATQRPETAQDEAKADTAETANLRSIRQ
jgi:integrase